MTSEAERIRVFKRKCRPEHKLKAGRFRNSLWFMEAARRPVTRGSLMMITDIDFPVTPYGEDSAWWLPLYFKIEQRATTLDRLLAYQDRQEAEQESRLTEIVEEFENELVTADRGIVTYDMLRSGVPI